MRTIKFRGKSIRTGQWVYGYFIRSSDGERCYIQSNDFTVTETIEVHEKSVGQLTGLTDKNGKEIYDGDVLLLPDTESHSVDVGVGVPMKVAETPVGAIAEVVYQNGGFGVSINGKSELWNTGFTSFHNTDYTKPKDCDNAELQKEIEVIGNIYENPELLTQ